MPFEIAIDRQTHQTRITRADLPDLVFDIKNNSILTKTADHFTSEADRFCLVVRLPDGRYFSLASVPDPDKVKTLKAELVKWLANQS